MAKETLAGKWMAENGHLWGKRTYPLSGKASKANTGVAVRQKRGKQTLSQFGGETIKDFVDRHRHHTGLDCVFVPAAQKGVPASVVFLGRQMSASRYMCLVTHGTPKYEGAIARHTCGNGHLSCVNPRHIAWGDEGDNQSDANHHRTVGDNVQDRINSVTR